MRLIIFLFIACMGVMSHANESDLNQIGQSSDRIKALTEKLVTGSVASVNDLEGELINQWLLSCNVDRFTSNKQCYLRNMDKDLLVFRQNGQNFLSVGVNHFPGKGSAIKIDNNPTLNGKDGSILNASAAIDQMRKGKAAFTRYMRWPYEVNIDNEVDLNGFEEAYKEMMSQYKNLK